MSAPAWTDDNAVGSYELEKAQSKNRKLHQNERLAASSAQSHEAIEAMKDALGENIPRGAAGTTIHYVSPGTSLDWAVLFGGVEIGLAAEVYSSSEDDELASWAAFHASSVLLQEHGKATGARANRHRSQLDASSQAESDGAQLTVFDAGAPSLTLEKSA